MIKKKLKIFITLTHSVDPDERHIILSGSSLFVKVPI